MGLAVLRVYKMYWSKERFTKWWCTEMKVKPKIPRKMEGRVSDVFSGSLQNGRTHPLRALSFCRHFGSVKFPLFCSHVSGARRQCPRRNGANQGVCGEPCLNIFQFFSALVLRRGGAGRPNKSSDLSSPLPFFVAPTSPPKMYKCLNMESLVCLGH